MPKGRALPHATHLLLAVALAQSGCSGASEGASEPGAGAGPALAAPAPAAQDEPVEAEDVAATPAPADLSTHEVALVVVHDDPLLRSEQRLVDVIVARMAMRRIDAAARDADAEEASFARAFFAGAGDASAGLPASLRGPGVVLFLRFAPQRELSSGDRATRGFAGALAFREGEATPFLSLRVDDEAGWRGPDEQLWPWLISLVRAEAAS